MPTQTPTAFPKISRTIDDIRSELYGHLAEVQEEYAAKGWLPRRLNLNKGVVRGLIELYAWGLWQVYNLLEKIMRQAFPLYATGEWLDLHCVQIGADRKSATKTRGKVSFIRTEGAEGNVRIPAGRIVRTQPDGLGYIYRYVSLMDAVLPTGAESVDVLCEAEEYGSLSNAGAGQINELVTPVAGISGVSNAAGWITEEGANVESDAECQRRYALSWEALAGVTSAKYKAVALGVKGVADVAVADQHPRGEGTIDVIIKGTAGIPTENLLAEVRAALKNEIVINHDLLVKGPAAVNVAVAFTLELLSGDAAATKLAAENYIQAVFTGNNPAVPGLGIGEDVIRDRLASGIITLPGVKRIIWGGDLESGDITVAIDELAVLKSLTVTTSWAAEA
ncbi:MAG: baseplate J/gp47 family protein [Desulfarculales bacterium]|jgi:uncharacterized phage protein gp47/JayE|nr:baseplate J/gp47 family protein [Desulfarculales bacterium]